jgi:rRNA-processing protein FCF1
MNELIYLDTNIYLDYLESREDRLRPLGEFAFRLLQRTLKCEFKIVISDVVNKELDRNIEADKIKGILDDLKEA